MSIKSSNNQQAGIALILCMILVSIFAALTIYISEKEKTQLTIMKGLQDRLYLDFTAHSLLQKLHFSVLTNGIFEWEGKQYSLNGAGLSTQIEQPYKITLTIQDAQGLMSATEPNRELMTKLIDSLSAKIGIGTVRVGEKVMDAWYDWEDKDNLERINGKEKNELDGYYPRNDKIQIMTEIRLLENMPRLLYAELEPYLIYHNLTEFIPAFANEELGNLLDLPPELLNKARNSSFQSPNGLEVQQLQRFKVMLELESDYARFERYFVITYRPDETRLVSISEFGD